MAQTFPFIETELIQALLVKVSDKVIPAGKPVTGSTIILSRAVFPINPSTLSTVNPLLASDPPSKSSAYNVCALA